MNFERSSGILLHVSSLPSPYGIGDMGSSALEFVDFLSVSGQKYWQLLPLNPTREVYSNSPYSTQSAFAGNLLLISPDELAKDGFLTNSDLSHSFRFKDHHVDFGKVTAFKTSLLEKAYKRFRKKKMLADEFDAFCAKNDSWLNDHTLFTAIKHYFEERAWTEWPKEIRDRKKEALDKLQKELTDIEKEKFFQFIFFRQWQHVKEHCHKKGIKLIGDIPFYVNHDSADCWANSKFFNLDKKRAPVTVSGVPPDYFSETGQLWGTPVYNWTALMRDNFSWWINRIKQNLFLFDIVRLDHFRAFSAFWEVPAGDDTAVNGKWTKVPGIKFFQQIKEQFPGMPFIAEDLGTLDDAVIKLRDRFKLPGMRVLLFSFGDDMSRNPYILHNHIPDSIVYTGTHDNNTVKGWYRKSGKEERERLKAYAGRSITVNNVAPVMQRMALMSVANLVILPVQDVLGMGEEAIMNRPGTTSDNWTWRLPPNLLTTALASDLKSLTALYGRY